jgi:hypothetical protein
METSIAGKYNTMNFILTCVLFQDPQESNGEFVSLSPRNVKYMNLDTGLKYKYGIFNLFIRAPIRHYSLLHTNYCIYFCSSAFIPWETTFQHIATYILLYIYNGHYCISSITFLKVKNWIKNEKYFNAALTPFLLSSVFQLCL